MGKKRITKDPGAGPTAGARAGTRPGTLGAVLLLALLSLQGLVFVTESSQTSDEAAHIAAGYSYLKAGDFRLNPEHPPLIKEWAALPLLALDLKFPWGPLWEQAEEWNIGRIFVHENLVSNDTILLLSRLPVLLLSVLLGYALFLWARRLFGHRAALLSLALYVLDPNVVAHSALVTTDLGITLFIFLSVYALWCWAERPSPSRLLLLALAVGGAFATKYTALWLLPILGALGVILLLTDAPLPDRPWASRSSPAAGGRFGRRRIRAIVLVGLAVTLVTLLVVALTYGIVGTPSFLVGLHRTLAHSAMGHGAYLMGEYSETGWRYYFPFAFLIKTPPGIIFVVAFAYLAMALGQRRPARDEIFLHVPILLILAMTSVWKVNIGLRHLMPLYPFLYISAGRIVADWPARRPVPKLRRALAWATIVCLCWNLWEAFAIAPHHLAYFNQFVGGPRNGHKYLLDSNLDWGQSAKALRRYMESERVPMIYLAYSGNSDPWYYGVRYQYVSGSGNLNNAKNRMVLAPDGMRKELFAVSAMVAHSVHFSRQDLYDWLDDRPVVAMPGYSFLVYDITGDAEMHANIAVVCLNFGLPNLAEAQAHRVLRMDPENRLAIAVLEEIRRRDGATDETDGNDRANGHPGDR